MANLLVHATVLQAKWRGEVLPPCDHLSQVAALVVCSQDGVVTSKYRCRDCGEVITRTYQSPAFAETPPID